MKVNNWLVSRDQVNNIAREIFMKDSDFMVNDETWAKVTDELSGRVENYINEILPHIVEDTLNDQWESERE
jgi:hypothetical protein